LLTHYRISGWLAPMLISVGLLTLAFAALGNVAAMPGGVARWTSRAALPHGVNTATPTPACTTLHILIVYSDAGIAPTQLQSDLAVRYNVSVVDLFNAQNATPTLAQLQAYNEVVVFSNTPYANGVTLGDNLATYQDLGGTVFGLVYTWANTSGRNIAGRWLTDGYSPFVYTNTTNFSDDNLGIFDVNSPFMQNVGSAAAHFRYNLALAAGATEVGTWSDGTPFLAVKGRALGISAYLGSNPNSSSWSGDFAVIIANAGNYYLTCVTITATATTTNTPLPSNTPTSTATRTATPPVTNTPSNTATATDTVQPTSTATPIATNTSTALPTSTASASATATATDTPNPSTATPTGTPLPPTYTPLPTATPAAATDTPLPTATPGGPTATAALPTDTPQPTVTPTDCPNPFVDINGNVFYGAIHYLACRHVVNGTDAAHYSPGATSTRGQFAKVVVLGFGTPFYTPSGSQDFSDVPPTYFAYLYIETGFHAAILSGFDAANCIGHGAAYPCYLPNLAITRGQLTKLVVNAAQYPLYTPGSGPTFTDVPTSNVFYVSIETAAHKAVVNGYPDHTFRPNNNIRRDEMAQIVFKAVITP
jgi:hypothetical protein